jgi:hypothetical protein
MKYTNLNFYLMLPFVFISSYSFMLLLSLFHILSSLIHLKPLIYSLPLFPFSSFLDIHLSWDLYFVSCHLGLILFCWWMLLCWYFILCCRSHLQRHCYVRVDSPCLDIEHMCLCSTLLYTLCFRLMCIIFFQYWYLVVIHH